VKSGAGGLKTGMEQGTSDGKWEGKEGEKEEVGEIKNSIGTGQVAGAEKQGWRQVPDKLYSCQCLRLVFTGSTESESEESERFHFLLTPLTIPLLTIYQKPDCGIRKQKPKDRPITVLFPTLCDWLSSSASAYDSDNLVFTRS